MCIHGTRRSSAGTSDGAGARRPHVVTACKSSCRRSRQGRYAMRRMKRRWPCHLGRAESNGGFRPNLRGSNARCGAVGRTRTIREPIEQRQRARVQLGRRCAIRRRLALHLLRVDAAKTTLTNGRSFVQYGISAWTCRLPIVDIQARGALNFSSYIELYPVGQISSGVRSVGLGL